MLVYLFLFYIYTFNINPQKCSEHSNGINNSIWMFNEGVLRMLNWFQKIKQYQLSGQEFFRKKMEIYVGLVV